MAIGGRSSLRIACRLPRFLRQPILERFWRSYWREQELEERLALGVASTESIRGSERAVLIESIIDCYPFTSLLEVGCGYAQNFHVLADLLPQVRLAGIDIDAGRIDEGQALLQRKGVSAVLAEGDVCDLSVFADRSVDIVMACALLLFVEPERIEQAVREMLRVARKSVLLLEQHQENPANPTQELGVKVPMDTGRSDYFLRDYRSLFERVAAQMGRSVRVQSIKIEHPRWVIEQWQQYAYVFRIDV